MLSSDRLVQRRPRHALAEGARAQVAARRRWATPARSMRCATRCSTPSPTRRVRRTAKPDGRPADWERSLSAAFYRAARATARGSTLVIMQRGPRGSIAHVFERSFDATSHASVFDRLCRPERLAAASRDQSDRAMSTCAIPASSYGAPLSTKPAGGEQRRRLRVQHDLAAAAGPAASSRVEHPAPEPPRRPTSPPCGRSARRRARARWRARPSRL